MLSLEYNCREFHHQTSNINLAGKASSNITVKEGTLNLVLNLRGVINFYFDPKIKYLYSFEEAATLD